MFFNPILCNLQCVYPKNLNEKSKYFKKRQKKKNLRLKCFACKCSNSIIIIDVDCLDHQFQNVETVNDLLANKMDEKHRK